MNIYLNCRFDPEKRPFGSIGFETPTRWTNSELKVDAKINITGMNIPKIKSFKHFTNSTVKELKRWAKYMAKGYSSLGSKKLQRKPRIDFNQGNGSISFYFKFK